MSAGFRSHSGASIGTPRTRRTGGGRAPTSSARAWRPRISDAPPEIAGRARGSRSSPRYTASPARSPRGPPASRQDRAGPRSRRPSTGSRPAAGGRSPRRSAPVRPIPPTVARNSSRSTSGPQTTSPPSATRRRRRSTKRPNDPSRWWFLPCTSAATHPPTVTNLVPGVTGGNQPRGRKTLRISASESPASHVSRPEAASKSRMRSARGVATTWVSARAGTAASPYARPSPRPRTVAEPAGRPSRSGRSTAARPHRVPTPAGDGLEGHLMLRPVGLPRQYRLATSHQRLEQRGSICFVRALDSRRSVLRVRRAGCLRAPPRSWTLSRSAASSDGLLAPGAHGFHTGA